MTESSTLHCTAALMLLTIVGIGCTAPSAPSSSSTKAPRVLWSSQVAALPVPTTKPLDPDADMPPQDFADQEFAKPLSRETAFAILLNTDTFAGTYVGYAGSKSIQVEAFQTLLARADALDVFRDLRNRARRPGQLYALCAFRLISPADYAFEEPHFIGSGDSVIEQWGCMGMPRPVSEIVRFESPITVRLKPGQTYDQWLSQQTEKTHPVQFDIAGGVIPDMFRSAR